ncbi:MAG: MmcQ/YjbR family DNA-binding protein [Pseudomonas sp.]|uniref:MmcQ/YjbR family DNA-binding protein n=1 Tax=Pseudomonas sp. TaxID=306 RepID=UPI0033918BEC
MNSEAIAIFCRSLPGVREDLKWGDNRVFSIAGTKMFAILDFLGQDLAFKVDDELFLGFVERPGFRPAPYLARARWVSLAPPFALSDGELQSLLTRSHQLVVKRLPKIRQVGLLLDC